MEAEEVTRFWLAVLGPCSRWMAEVIAGITADDPEQLLSESSSVPRKHGNIGKANAAHWGAGPNSLNGFTYSPRLNTCVLYEEHQNAEAGLRRSLIIDVLTGREIHGIWPDVLGLFRKPT